MENSYPDYNYVQKCILKIEDALDWGNSNTWHNDVFIELSEKIHQKTQVLLSPTTLKRVWGHVKYTNKPSISTLNALAQFAGFKNWREYKNLSNIKESNWFDRKISPNLRVITVSAAIMTLVFISFYSMIGINKSPEKVDLSKVKFESKSVSKGLPNTVVFDFDLKNIKSDSLLIQQFWDKSKTIKIKQGQTQATGQYYYPGYYRAKLLVDRVIIKEHDLFIESNGWLGTLDYKPIPKYQSENDLLNNNLSFTPSIIDEIKKSDVPLITGFHLIENMKEVSGDNFELKAAVKNVYRDKWAVCQKLTIAIIGTKSALLIPFSIPGCTSELGIMMSDVYISGKENDLSSLGIDLSEFRLIQLNVAEKQLTVIVDEQKIYSNSYNESIGKVVGLRFKFLGAGEVEQVSIKRSLDSEYILNQNFTTGK